MVIPVPVVLHEGDVKTLPKEVFRHVEQMGAPRLVEYWEQDPCAQAVIDKLERDRKDDDIVYSSAQAGSGVNLGVTIEAKFVVGEYQIVILSAKDSTGLDTWLRQENYNIPAGAEPLLRPYVESGMKFFVAKVDPKKVAFENAPRQHSAGPAPRGPVRAALSPLRFHYDAEEFALPIRLGLANSSGTQDLIVNILAPQHRYEVANYPNVTIPTNIELKASAKDKFGAFYAALFDRTIEANKGAVVTEYAWQASSCDPCPGPTLDMSEIQTLGADVLDGPSDKPAPSQDYDFVLTRLHARYGKDITNDLVFKQAKPIHGGNENPGPDGTLQQGAYESGWNSFQARYVIRHPWTGPIRCVTPHRGVWGGPPSEIAAKDSGVKPALDLAYAPRDLQLASVVARDVPAIGVTSSGGGGARAGRGNSGCGCDTGGASGGIVMLALLVLVRRRR
jgi:MYXO-CTERM domain-containing protein